MVGFVHISISDPLEKVAAWKPAAIDFSISLYNNSSNRTVKISSSSFFVSQIGRFPKNENVTSSNHLAFFLISKRPSQLLLASS
jgi:hypothetical protein